MRNALSGRWAVVGIVGAVLLAAAIVASQQSQQRVQTTVQLTVRTPVVADELDEWEMRYAEAMEVVAELAESGSREHAERLEGDLEGLDEALRRYVRVSERLRHKNRALAETMEFLALQNAMQMESRQYQALSNASRVAHDVAMASVRNLK
jgi:hypothetical protein